MNTIFVDVASSNKAYSGLKNKLVSINKKIKKYDFRVDYLNNTYTNSNMYLTFDPKYFDTVVDKKNNVFKEKSIDKILTKKLKKMDKLYIVSSKNVDQNQLYQKYVNMILPVKDKKIEYINEKNTMFKNDMKYIDKFVNENKIKDNKLKILLVLDDINDFDNKKVIEYISKYKYLDILRMNNIGKTDYKVLSIKIDEINEEYGTTISIIQKKNLLEYNVYLAYSNVPRQEFIQKYALRKKSLFIEMQNAEFDVFNDECKLYEQNKYNIKTVFDRNRMQIENYSKNKLGAWYKISQMS